MNKGKRQVAKPTNRQLGARIATDVLNQLSKTANGLRDLLKKGKALDMRTGQPIKLICSIEDIRRSLSPEQRAAIDEFISTWGLDDEPEPKAGLLPLRKRSKQ